MKKVHFTFNKKKKEDGIFMRFLRLRWYVHIKIKVYNCVVSGMYLNLLKKKTKRGNYHVIFTSGIRAETSQEFESNISLTVHCPSVNLENLCPALQIRQSKLNLTVQASWTQ